MTDGERLVWSTSYAIAIARGSDAVLASQVAAAVVGQLREAAAKRRLVPSLSSSEVDEQQFLDEIVNVP